MPLVTIGMLGLDDLRQRRSLKWNSHPDDVIPAFVAEMDFSLASAVATAISDSLLRAGGDFGYPLEILIPEISSAFCSFAERRFRWSVDPGRVYVLPDVMRGIELWIQGFTQPGDGVVVNTPVYGPFLDAVTNAGRRIVEAPFLLADTRWEVDFDSLREAFQSGNRLYLLANPHNPLGRSLTESELVHIAELATKHQVRVVSDEIHAPIVYNARHIPLATISPEIASSTLTLHSATKAWNFSGLNCAIAVPGSAADELYIGSLPSRTRGNASITGIEATIAAYDNGEEWLNMLLQSLDHNRMLLSRLLSNHLPAAKYIPPEATYLAWLNCREVGFSEQAAATFLRYGKVALDPGEAYGSGGSGYVRLNFATSPDILTEIVARMARAVSEFRR